MSANNYPLDEDVTRDSERVTAFFTNQNDAYRALTELKQQGFSNDQIGLAALDSDAESINDTDNASLRMLPDEGAGQTRIDTNVSEPNNASLRMRPDEGEGQHHHRSFWQDVKNFFSGESHQDASKEDASDFRTATSGMNWSDERSSYYSRGLGSGGAIVTVVGANLENAKAILEHCGADLRESGFETFDDREQLAGTLHNIASEIGTRFGTGTADYADNEQQRIQLQGELLRAHRERVQRGDVRLRKEVVTENQTIEVPVTREELVIERVQPTNATASGEIGDNAEIRVPLSEERVIPEKQRVVNEEVRVGKRQVTGIQQVSSDVRHEELRVEGDKDLAENEDVNAPRTRKPAA